MNNIKKLSRKGKIAIAGSCLLLVIIVIGILGVILGGTNNNPSTDLAIANSTTPNIPNTPLSNSTSDYTSKVNSITKNTNNILNESYTVLDGLASGSIDENTAISRLQNDKKHMDNSLSELQSLNPPQNMQHFHSLLVSALQDFDSALSLEIAGLKNGNVNDIQRSIDLTNSAVSKLNEAKKESNSLT